jgi:hypothetical protein
VSKVWKFNIKIDLGKAKELTIGGVIGGVLMAVLTGGAETITQLAIGHGWKSAVASGEKTSVAPAQTRADQMGCLPSMPFSDRRPTVFAFQMAPTSFAPWWWHFYEELSRNALNGAPYHSSQVRDQQLPSVPTARR